MSGKRPLAVAIAASCGMAFVFIAVLVVFAPRGHTPVAAVPAARAQSRAADTVGLLCQQRCDVNGSCRNYPLTVDLDNRKITVGTGSSAIDYQITDFDDAWINGENHHPRSDLVVGYFRISINRNSLQIIIQPYSRQGKLMFGDETVAQCWRRQL